MVGAVLPGHTPGQDKFLNSADWQKLQQSLLDFVQNFEIKVVEARSGFQL